MAREIEALGKEKSKDLQEEKNQKEKSIKELEEKNKKTSEKTNIEHPEQKIEEPEVLSNPEPEKSEEKIEITKKQVSAKLLKEMMKKYGKDRLISINISRKTSKDKLKYYVRTKIAELLIKDGVKFDANSYSIILSDLPNQKQLNKGNLEWQSGRHGTDRLVNFKITNTKTKQTTIVKSYYRFYIK